MSEKKQTTIELKGKEIPFYRTNRGLFDFENAGYSAKDMADGKMSAMLAFIFFQSRDCAKRAGVSYPFSSLIDFIDHTEPDIIGVFARLKQAEAGESTVNKEGAEEGKQ